MKNSIKNVFTLVFLALVAFMSIQTESHTDFTCKKEWNAVLVKDETSFTQKSEEAQEIFPAHGINLFMPGSLRALIR
jgi:hypothetical protein